MGLWSPFGSRAISGADAYFVHHDNVAICLKDMPCSRLMTEQTARGKQTLCSPFVQKEKNNCFWHLFLIRHLMFLPSCCPWQRSNFLCSLDVAAMCVVCLSQISFHIPLLCLTNENCMSSACDCSFCVVSLMLHATGCAYDCYSVIVLTFDMPHLFRSPPLMQPNREYSNDFSVLISELLGRWVFSLGPFCYLETSAGFI